MTNVRYWFNELKHGRTSVFDEECPGRPIEMTSEHMDNKTDDIVLTYRINPLRMNVAAQATSHFYSLE